MHETLATLVWHTHVARHQAAEWRRLLDGLQPGEVALSMDFFENASFAPNRSPQSNYWGKIQATNFIAITWLWACDSDGTERRVKTEHVFISPDRNHSHRCVLPAGVCCLHAK